MTNILSGILEIGSLIANVDLRTRTERAEQEAILNEENGFLQLLKFVDYLTKPTTKQSDGSILLDNIADLLIGTELTEIELRTADDESTVSAIAMFANCVYNAASSTYYYLSNNNYDGQENIELVGQEQEVLA